MNSYCQPANLSACPLTDPGKTALKYERLLDAASEIEAELALDGLRPIAQEVVDAYLKAAAFAFPRSILQRARLAAASEATAPSLLKWTSPEGGCVAYLPLIGAEGERSWLHIPHQVNDDSVPYDSALPLPPAESEMLTIRFYALDGAPATALSGQPVSLAGVSGRIDPEAKAVFPTRAIEQSEENLRLEVGETKVTWHPEPK